MNIITTQIEEKTCEHYVFLKKQFDDTFLEEEKFIDNDNYTVLTTRDGEYLVGAMLINLVTLYDYKSTFKIVKINNFNIFDRFWKSLYGKTIPKYKEVKKRSFTRTPYYKHHIVYTVVNPTYRGMGLNQLMLDYLYEHMEFDSYRYIIANIRESNEKSLNSFFKNGFLVSKSYSKPYKNGEKKIRVYRKYGPPTPIKTIENVKNITKNTNKKIVTKTDTKG